MRTTATASTADEKNPEENAIDTSSQVTSTQRPPRTRPTFNLRGRTRSTLSSTSASIPSESGNDSTDQSDFEQQKIEPNEEKPSTTAPLKPSSRFNLRRPNQLLIPRGRISPFAKAISSNTDNQEATNSTDNEKTSTSTQASDLNKEFCKNRK